MTVKREDRPYMQFNFQVQINGEVAGGFQEISGIGTEVPATEYRHGNDKENNVRKLAGLNKSSDVTLKRGVMGTEYLADWIDGFRKGNGELRTVRIDLLNEERAPVMGWVLNSARPSKLTYGAFNAKGNDVAMEEVVLICEKVELARDA
jgi:phage tail-like protein